MNRTNEYTILRGGSVLDIKAHHADRADLLVRGDTIEAIGPPGLAAPAPAVQMDATDRLLIPGLINAHTHGHGGLAKGSGDRWTLELLLNAAPWISGNRNTEHIYLSALVGALEMLRKGCTACYDLYLEIPIPSEEGLQAVGRAYEDAGMRAIVAPMTADRTLFEAIPGLLSIIPDRQRREVEQLRLAPLKKTVDACRTLIKSWPFDPARIGFALAPTIPLHCSDDFLVANRDLAREFGVGLHMHLAESKVQALSGLEWYGKTLTAHLDALGFLGPNLTAAHAVWLDADDIQRLADHGASVAHNPGSNMRLGSGLAAIREMSNAGVNVGIGTDGSNCSDNQNMFEAMRFSSFVSRVRSHDYHNWLTTDEVLTMATEGSANALGLGDQIGRLAPGYKADIVFLDLNHVNFLPLIDPSNQLVLGEDGSAVQSVMVDGRIVMQDGEFANVNLGAIRPKVEQAIEELRGLNASAKQLATALEDHVGEFCIGLTQQSYHVRAMAGEAYGC